MSYTAPSTTAYRVAFAFCICLAMSIFLSCQNPIEPTDQPIADAVELNVRVTDESGTPIANAGINARAAERQQPVNNRVRSISGAGLTSNAGEIRLQLSGMPASGDSIEITLNAPSGNQFTPNTTTATIFVPCSNSTINLSLSRPIQNVSCGTIVQDSVNVSVCNNGDPILDEKFTTRFSQNCGVSIPVTLVRANPLSGVAITVLDAQNREQATTFDMQSGVSYQVRVRYNPTVRNPGTLSEFVQLRGGNISGGNSFVLNIRVSAVVQGCVSFVCPTQDIIEERQQVDTVCPGTSNDISISLSNTRNFNTLVGSRFQFSLLGLPAPSLSVQSPTLPFSLLNGQSLAQMRIRFTAPASLGRDSLLRDSLIFSIRRIGPTGVDSGLCSQRLIVRFANFVRQPLWRIDTANSTLFSSTTRRIDTLQQCLDAEDVSKARTIRIINPSNCAVNLNLQLSTQAPALSAIFTFSGSNVTITGATLSANSSQDFQVRFLPQRLRDMQSAVNFLPTAPERRYFNALLRISSNNALPIPTQPQPITLNLIGRADTCCFPNSSSLVQYGLNTEFFENIQFLENGTFNKSGVERLQTDVTAINVNTTTRTARLVGGTPNSTVRTTQFIRLGNNPLVQNVCNERAVLALARQRCGEAGATEIDINDGDFILITKRFTDGTIQCGLVYILDVRSDRSNPQIARPTVYFNVLYPLP